MIKEHLMELLSDWTSLALVSLGVVLTKLWNNILKLFKNAWIWVEKWFLSWFRALLSEKLRRILTLREFARWELTNDKYRFLQIPGSKIAHPIETIFVPLKISGSQQTYTADSVLDLGKYIIIMGEPGSGKTSLVRKMYLDACRKHMNYFSSGYFPLIIDLKVLEPPSKGNDWLYEKIIHDLEEKNIQELQLCFEAMSEGASGILIFLDGLDEVSSAAYPKVRDAIITLCKKMEATGVNNRLLLTMRTQFHQQVGDDFKEYFANLLELKRFSSSDVFEFLSRWPFVEDREVNIARIHQSLVTRPTLREMCTNPLVLAMYVARTVENIHEYSPTTRTDFYRIIIEELLFKRRMKQWQTESGGHSLKDQREQVLGRLAYEHLMDETQNRNNIDHDDALKIAGQIIGTSPKQVEMFLKEMAKDTGLLSEGKVRGSWMFSHLTFCEYFAALYAVERQKNGWREVREKNQYLIENPSHATRLEEVIPFAFGLFSPKERKHALSDLRGFSQSRLIMRCFFECKMYHDQLWTEFTEKMTERLQKVQTWERDLLDELLWFTITIGDANYESTTAMGIKMFDLEGFLKVLLKQNQDHITKLIETYAQTDPEAALHFIEVCSLNPLDFKTLIKNNCHQPLFLTLLHSRVVADKENAYFWANLFLESCDSKSKYAHFANEPAWLDLAPVPDQVPVQVISKHKGNSNLLSQLLVLSKKRNNYADHILSEEYTLVLLVLIFLLNFLCLPVISYWLLFETIMSFNTVLIVNVYIMSNFLILVPRRVKRFVILPNGLRFLYLSLYLVCTWFARKSPFSRIMILFLSKK